MVIFKRLRYKNYLATGDSWTEIELDKHPNTLIIGKNGSGKTTFLSALCWVLFNNPYRKINIPQVINSINQRDCVGEVEFEIGPTKYKVVRGLKPNFFEIYQNGKMLDQSASKKDYQGYLEKSILKMNYKSFTQIVALGSSAFIPFMQLPAAHRRGVVEEILDIQIFSAMNVIIKQKLLEIRDGLENNRRDIELAEEKHKLIQKHLGELKTNNKAKIKENNQKIRAHKRELKILQDKYDHNSKEYQRLEKFETESNKNETKRQTLRDYKIKINGNLERYQGELAFYKDNKNCPTCHQDIETDLREKKVKELNEKISKIEEGLAQLESLMSEILKKQAYYTDIHVKRETHKSDATGQYHQLKVLKGYIEKLEEENKELEKGPVTSSGESYTQRLDDVRNKITELETQKEKFLTDREYLEMAANLLKDSGIKTKIIRQYLPILNKLVNKYLGTMDFFVNFNLDENFNETILSRNRDDFTYDSFSDGEKQRINMSLLFTWRAIAKRKNSVSTNLLILDEVFDSSLEAEGIESLLKIIQTLGDDTNIFVISHKGDILFDKFKSIIKFEKRNNFSQMVPVT